MHLVQREPWATIDLDVTNGHVFVRQDWCYEWIAAQGLPPWTEEEKTTYHHAVDHLIWGHWSMRATILLRRRDTGNTRATAKDVLAHFQHRSLTLSFDVRRVPTRAQWSVQVAKVDPIKDNPKLNPALESWPRPLCWFSDRKLLLYDMSVTPRSVRQPAGADGSKKQRKLPNFYAATHEFGHTIGYANPLKDADEYEPDNLYRRDVKSIMNIGRRLRSRHFFLLMAALGKMVPSWTFSARVEP